MLRNLTQIETDALGRADLHEAAIVHNGLVVVGRREVLDSHRERIEAMLDLAEPHPDTSDDWRVPYEAAQALFIRPYGYSEHGQFIPLIGGGYGAWASIQPREGGYATAWLLTPDQARALAILASEVPMPRGKIAIYRHGDMGIPDALRLIVRERDPQYIEVKRLAATGGVDDMDTETDMTTYSYVTDSGERALAVIVRAI